MELRKVARNPYRKFKGEWEDFDREHGLAWNKEDLFFEAVEGGELAGYFAATFNGGVGELKEMLVRRRYRKTGVGKWIVERFVDMCRERRCHKMRILTSERNRSAMRLYEGCGFSKEASSEDDMYHMTWYTYSRRI